MPHSSWWIPQKHRVIDIKGVAVALAFLVAVSLFAGGRGDKDGADSVPSDALMQGESRQAGDAFLTTRQDRPGERMKARSSSDPLTALLREIR
jgi:hypothetical protein